MNDYRALWQYATKTTIPEGYIIHHLNFIHTDSRIGNIIALPCQLHGKFHNLVRNTTNKVDLYYAILNIKFDSKYLRYMKRIDNKITSNVIKGVLLRSVGIPTTLDCVKCNLFYQKKSKNLKTHF